MSTKLNLQSTRPQLGIVRQPAPDWDVSQWRQLPDGLESLNVDDYRGKVLYLYFFQSWCPGCHSSGFPTLVKLQREFADNDDVAFVVIQTTFEGHEQNGPDKLKPTAERYDLSIPFGQSAGDSGTPEIMQRYRTGGTAWVVMVDRNGTVVFNDFRVAPEAASAAIRELSK